MSDLCGPHLQRFVGQMTSARVAEHQSLVTWFGSRLMQEVGPSFFLLSSTIGPQRKQLVGACGWSCCSFSRSSFDRDPENEDDSFSSRPSAHLHSSAGQTICPSSAHVAEHQSSVTRLGIRLTHGLSNKGDAVGALPSPFSHLHLDLGQTLCFVLVSAHVALHPPRRTRQQLI